MSYSALNDADVHYYVPNHRLSNELVKSLSEELDLNLNETESFSRVKVIASRSQKNEMGNPFCQKSELAESLAEISLNVSKSPCSNGVRRLTTMYPSESMLYFSDYMSLNIVIWNRLITGATYES
tara:strand:- start:125 stop:499 length:375 start_codon:yes stop_codon:yes gene_type:complete